MPEASLPSDDRLALRRASLTVALRDGDVHRVARAWSRLRVRGASLDAHGFAAGRTARGEMGHALRLARERRSRAEIGAPEQITAASVAHPAAPPRWWRLAGIAVACAGLALALLPLLPAVAPAHRYVLSAPLPIASALVASRVGGRGRTEATLAPILTTTFAPRSSAPAAAAAPAAVASSAAPSAAQPTPALPASPKPSPTPVPVASVPVAAPTQLPPPAATPRAGVTPGPVPPGYSRLIVLVVDATTIEPVAGACIVIGAPDCSPSRPHTNSAGLWWIEFPTGQMAGTQWPVQIVKGGYATLAVTVTTTGVGQQFVAPLQPLQ
ncbi:MAG: hypothetical protein KGK34_12930 [Chloroflexota bacterium]|nr:hypothetical protein [Chloroflexota bacterium]